MPITRTEYLKERAIERQRAHVDRLRAHFAVLELAERQRGERTGERLEVHGDQRLTPLGARLLDELTDRADVLLAGAVVDRGARSRLRECFRWLALVLGERGESSPALIGSYAAWTCEALGLA
ncbi:MAG: hypothetical protein AB1730_26805 [Myxococcota bacterium]